MRREGHIYLQGEGHRHHQGPFTEQDLRRYWAYGIVKDDDWVWLEGAPDCVQVKDFFGLTPQKISAKATRQAVIHRPANNEADDLPPARQDVPVFDQSWVLQVFAWLVAVVATVCFLSLPAAVWLSMLLYAASLTLLGWFIWLKKNTIAWLALGINVLLVVTVIFFQPHGQAKNSPFAPAKISNQLVHSVH